MKGWRRGERGRGRGTEDDVLEAGTSAFSPNTASDCLGCLYPSSTQWQIYGLSLCMYVYA